VLFTVSYTSIVSAVKYAVFTYYLLLWGAPCLFLSSFMSSVFVFFFLHFLPSFFLSLLFLSQEMVAFFCVFRTATEGLREDFPQDTANTRSSSNETAPWLCRHKLHPQSVVSRKRWKDVTYSNHEDVALMTPKSIRYLTVARHVTNTILTRHEIVWCFRDFTPWYKGV